MSTSACILSTLAALTIAALWSLPDTAVAGPTAASAVVRFRDLDLSTDVGVRTLYKRIEGAAERVCFFDTPAGIDQQARYFACCEDTVANALKQIDDARLVALHRTQSRLARN